VKDELARPPVLGKDPCLSGIAHHQALLAEKKCAVFLSRAGKALAQKTSPGKDDTLLSLHLLRKGDYNACRTRLS
jgi:hypothetical protein